MKTTNVEANKALGKTVSIKLESDRDLLKRMKKSAKNTCKRVIKKITN